MHALSSFSRGVAALFLGALLGGPGAACGQDYALTWFNVGGGGMRSTGDVFTVTGTVGQPDAGTMRGGAFALQGGFWAATAVQTPGAPVLAIARAADGRVVLAWSLPAAGWVLGHTNTLVGVTSPWPAVPVSPVTNGSTISVTLPIAPGNHFFRLRPP